MGPGNGGGPRPGGGPGPGGDPGPAGTRARRGPGPGTFIDITTLEYRARWGRSLIAIMNILAPSLTCTMLTCTYMANDGSLHHHIKGI